MSNIVTLLCAQPNFFSLAAANLKDIHDAETVLATKFSSEYKEYLQNIGLASYDGHELTGICAFKRLNVVDVTLEDRKLYRVPNDWYVIEETNIDGIVIWQAPDGSVYQTAIDQKPRKIAKSFSEYVLLY